MLIASLALVLVVVAVAAGSATRRALRARAELVRAGNVDPLTGLPTRLALQEALGAAIAGRGSGRFTALLIELDRFAAVNDTYGHDVGDQLLQAVAGQLRSALEPGEQLFRVGGPQLMVLSPRLSTAVEGTRRAEQLQQAVHIRFHIGHDQLRISACVGVVLADQRHTDPAVVLRDADVAVRAAARRGPGRTEVFEISLAPRFTPIEIPGRMRAALEHDELTLLYLPVVDVTDSRLVGVEALLRWVDPDRGLVGAHETLSLLEEADLMGPVGDWIVEEACRHNVEWHRNHPGADLMSTINISPRQLSDPALMDRILRIVHSSEVDPQRLCLEITEGAIRGNPDDVWSMLRRAKDAGIQLALDDFGTGYSTFGYIRRFHLDVLKIDQVFVSRLATSKDDAAIVQQLIGMAHALDYVAIAEGVDSAQQAAVLQSLDCDLAQGYHWCPPVPFATIDQLIPKKVVRPGTGRSASVDWKPPARPVG